MRWPWCFRELSTSSSKHFIFKESWWLRNILDFRAKNVRGLGSLFTKQPWFSNSSCDVCFILDKRLWKHIAQDHFALWCLLKEIQDFLFPLIFITVAINTYALCLQVRHRKICATDLAKMYPYESEVMSVDSRQPFWPGKWDCFRQHLRCLVSGTRLGSSLVNVCGRLKVTRMGSQGRRASAALPVRSRFTGCKWSYHAKHMKTFYFLK